MFGISTKKKRTKRMSIQCLITINRKKREERNCLIEMNCFVALLCQLEIRKEKGTHTETEENICSRERDKHVYVILSCVRLLFDRNYIG